MIDTTEIGVVAAKVMEDIEKDSRNGNMPDGARVASVLVAYEIDGQSQTRFGCKMTGNRMVIGLGLAEMAREAMKYGNTD